MSLPNSPTFEITPGAVLRRRHIDHIKRFLRHARDGQRGTRTWSFGVQFGRGSNMTIVTDGSHATLPLAGNRWVVPLQKVYYGDRILEWGISALRYSESPFLCELYRFKQHEPGDDEVLSSFEHYTVTLADRQLIAALHDPIKIELGYNYRIRVTAGELFGGEVWGGYVKADHPEV